MISRAAAYVRRHHVGLLALAVALSGTAYAVNSVGPRDIKRNAVLKRHIKHNAVGATELGRTVRFSKVVTVNDPPPPDQWGVGGGSVSCRHRTRAVGFEAGFLTGGEPRGISAIRLTKRGFFAAGTQDSGASATFRISVICLRK